MYKLQTPTTRYYEKYIVKHLTEGQKKVIISFSGQFFQKLMRQGGFIFYFLLLQIRMRVFIFFIYMCVCVNQIKTANNAVGNLVFCKSSDAVEWSFFF